MIKIITKGRFDEIAKECSECGAVFTFGTVDLQTVVRGEASIKVVGCPCCNVLLPVDDVQYTD